MAYYVQEQEVRDKLGNTIANNFSTTLIANAIAYGCDNVDALTTIDWATGMKYFGLAKGIAIDFAAAFCHATQINVSIQQLREWQMAVDDCKGLYTTLQKVGLINVGKPFTVSESFCTEVLNPATGTHVEGLRGIVSKRGLYSTDFFYTP